MFKKTSSARIYNLSLHDALPIFPNAKTEQPKGTKAFFFPYQPAMKVGTLEVEGVASKGEKRSEEHTSELQSPCNLVCRLLLEKKINHQLDARCKYKVENKP